MHVVGVAIQGWTRGAARRHLGRWAVAHRRVEIRVGEEEYRVRLGAEGPRRTREARAKAVWWGWEERGREG